MTLRKPAELTKYNHIVVLYCHRTVRWR